MRRRARSGAFLGVQFHRRERRRGARYLDDASPRLIPCLDVAARRVVKGIRFQGLRDAGDTVELGARYSEAER